MPETTIYCHMLRNALTITNLNTGSLNKHTIDCRQFFPSEDRSYLSENNSGLAKVQDTFMNP